MKKQIINKNKPVCLLLIGITVAVLLSACQGSEENQSPEHDVMIRLSDGTVYEGGDDLSGAGYNENISVPGYDTIELAADSKEQKVLFHNPEENTCCFLLSMILEDGTVIWEADSRLEPGTAFSTIILEEPLEEGEYENVTLMYKCCTLTDHRELNSSKITVTLNVV